MKSLTRALTLTLVVLFSIIFFTSPTNATYLRDLVMTGTDGPWTDVRSYSSISDAITAIGSDKQTLLIPIEVTCTSLTIPSNVTLKFTKNGAINNSGQLTIQTKDIIADSHQIFTGSGDIDFADTTEVKASWFNSLDDAISLTNDDGVRLIIDDQYTLDSSQTLGTEVILVFPSPDSAISTNAGATLSNISNIEAGKHVILTGDGDFDFVEGSAVHSSWFTSLRRGIAYIDDDDINLTMLVDGNTNIDSDTTTDECINLRVEKGNPINISAGVTLTINGPFEAGLYQVFSGDGDIRFGVGIIKEVYPQWFGAKGDWVMDIDGSSPFGTGTDDTVAIQKMFDSLTTQTDDTQALTAEAMSTNMRIIFPKGVYHISSPITIGGTGEYLLHLEIEFQQAAIHADLTGYSDTTFAVTITNLRFSTLRDVNIYCHVGSGLKLDTLSDCHIENLSVGANGNASLDLRGVVMSNTFNNLRLNQPHGFNGATYGLYIDTSIPTEDTWSNLVINSFDGTFIAGVDTFIYIKQANSIRFDVLELEGGTDPGVYVENGSRITFSNGYVEALSNPAYSFYFKNSDHITLSHITTGAYYHRLKFEDCTFINMDNLENGGPPVLVGANKFITARNCSFRATTPRHVFSGPSPASPPYTEVDDIDFKNVQVINTTDTTVKGLLNIESMALGEGESNLLYNPRALDRYKGTHDGADDAAVLTDSSAAWLPDELVGLTISNTTDGSSGTITANTATTVTATLSGGTDNDWDIGDSYTINYIGHVTSYRCDVYDDGTQTDVSPLGYREAIVEITSDASYPYLKLDIDTSRLRKTTTPAVLLIAWKYSPLSGTTDIASSGGLSSGAVYSANYGDIHFFQNDWIITATLINITHTQTDVTIVWNYNSTFNVGDKFLFGGAILYEGHKIKLP